MSTFIPSSLLIAALWLCSSLWGTAALAADSAADSADDGEVSVLSSDTSVEELTDDLVKLTWEAELENTGGEEATVTVTLDLLADDGTSLESFTIRGFKVPANASKTAVQSRPITASMWKRVDSHEVYIEE